MVTIGDIIPVVIAFLGLAVAIATPVAALAYGLRIFQGIALGD